MMKRARIPVIVLMVSRTGRVISYEKQVFHARRRRRSGQALMLTAILPFAFICTDQGSSAAPQNSANDDKRSDQESTNPEKKKKGNAPDGRLLAKQMNCRSCHIIEGEGGFIGPPLDGIGQHRDAESLTDKLSKQKKSPSNPPAYLTAFEIMSHVRIPHLQSKAIAEYLIRLPEAKIAWELKNHKTGTTDSNSIPPGSHFEARKPDASSARGKKLYLDHGCAACHSINNQGGLIGPTLSGVGALRSRNFIESRIANGALIGPDRKGEYKRMGYRMPPVPVSKTELSDITDFLLTLPSSSAKK
ncbi:MAG: hypothetical protein C0469_09065 [Cyanobacteria bacterium DS2.3.42]|nr:hypothetical protein [Cyanobacteria bacterium DS2.3.42]